MYSRMVRNAACKVQDVSNRKLCVGSGDGIWEVYILPTQSFCKPKTAFENKVS